ncbi:MAG: DUF928 domain-containing protein [Cyanobacteriota bacterium]|nr:DUF928 domain-containing protein [Cyanobacteriota bacterium]
MNSLKSVPLKLFLPLAFAGAIALGSLPQETIAQPSLGDRSTRIQFQPPGDPAPFNTSGGGVRGNIPPLENSARENARGDITFRPLGKPTPTRTVGSGIRGEPATELVPLLPGDQTGYTVSPRPTIYLYVPPTSPRQVFFSIQDENFEPHYHATLNLSGGGGIVSVTLPENAPELETGKYYTWFFAPLEADGILQPDNYGARGWIKRVEAPGAMGETVPPTHLERATLYAKEGIWYDTLALLLAARQAQPDNETIAQTWIELLEQVGLDEIARSPIAEQL